MIRPFAVLVAAVLAACGSSAPPDDEAVKPGATASYVTDAGRAEVLVTYPDTGIVRGANRFRFHPQGGAKLSALQALMPAHGHRMVAGLSQDGDAIVGDVDLSMPGRWELSASVEAESGSDQLRFSLIVP